MGCGNSKAKESALPPAGNTPQSPAQAKSPVHSSEPQKAPEKVPEQAVAKAPEKAADKAPEKAPEKPADAATPKDNTEVKAVKDQASAPTGPEPTPSQKAQVSETAKDANSSEPKPAPIPKPEAADSTVPAKAPQSQITPQETPSSSSKSVAVKPTSFGNSPSVVSWMPQYKIATSNAVTVSKKHPSCRNFPSVVSWMPQYNVKSNNKTQARNASGAANTAKTSQSSFRNSPSVVSWMPQYSVKIKKTFTLVLIRHGESQWNVENRFTGWVDVPLAPTGEAESHRAAKELRQAGLGFDVVYTSVLKRAIKTGMNVLEDLDLMHVPVHKDWRLNERHYGGLQGLNKKDTVEKHGEEKVNVWRRSYDVPPPEAEEEAAAAQAADPRYRGVGAEALPRSESLADVVRRFMPLWREVLGPAIVSGRRVLVAAHGNTLRALVKHLDGISEEVIAGLNIPTAVPLVYHLDRNLRPVPPPPGAPGAAGAGAWTPLSGYYLGDQEEIRKAIAGVSAQSKKAPAPEAAAGTAG